MSNRTANLVKEPVASPVGVHSGVAALRVIPLRIAPLLSPYRKHGRLSLRIERMPQLARLSAGRNNGNGSWSLGGDELDELTYMVPESAGAHTLAIRVISVDRGEGNTLAVLEYLVAADVPASAPGAPRETPPPFAPADAGIAGLQGLRDALAAAQAALAAREAELAKVQQRAELAELELARQRSGAEIAAAQADWKADLDKRLANAVSQSASELQQLRETWEAEQAERTAKLEERALERLLEARERWQTESESRLAKAEQAWKTEEAARCAALEAAFRQKLDRACADARTESGRGQAHAAELQALTDTLTSLKVALAERDAALQQADRSAAAKETQWRETLGALKAQLAARDSLLAETRGQIERARADGQALRDSRDSAKSEALQAQIAALQDTLSARETAQGKAKQNWTAKETQWRETLGTLKSKLAERDAALAQARSEIERARAEPPLPRETQDSRKIQSLEAELAALHDTLAARDTALTQAQSALHKTEIAQPRAIAEAVADAEKSWKTDEAARLADIEAKWRAYAEDSLADATRRAECAEAALEQLRLEKEAAPEPIPAPVAPRIVLRHNTAWQKEEPAPREPERGGGRRLFREALIAAALGASAIFAYPLIAPYLPPGMQLSAPAFAPPNPPAAAPAPVPAAPPADAALPAPVPRLATALKDANIRSGPSSTAPVIARLPRGATAPLAGAQGDWLLVEIERGAAGTAPRQGWIHRSLLSADGI